MSTYSIPDNFSIINNYEYDGKSKGMRFLDWASTPCRKALGGRDIDVASQTYMHPSSTAQRASWAALAILAAPVGIVSGICLLVKMISRSWLHLEIAKQSGAVNTAISVYETAVREQNDDQIIASLSMPGIHKREGAKGNTELFGAINRKINNGAGWDDIVNVLYLLSTTEQQVKLLDHAVKVKLNIQATSGNNTLDGDYIYNTFSRLLSLNSIFHFSKYLLEHSLKVQREDSIELTALKMDVAHVILARLKTYSMSNQSHLGTLVDGYRNLYAIESGHNQIFNNIEKMNEISLRATALRQTGALAGTFLEGIRNESDKSKLVEKIVNFLKEIESQEWFNGDVREWIQYMNRNIRTSVASLRDGADANQVAQHHVQVRKDFPKTQAIKDFVGSVVSAENYLKVTLEVSRFGILMKTLTELENIIFRGLERVAA